MSRRTASTATTRIAVEYLKKSSSPRPTGVPSRRSAYVGTARNAMSAIHAMIRPR